MASIKPLLLVRTQKTSNNSSFDFLFLHESNYQNIITIHIKEAMSFLHFFVALLSVSQHRRSNNNYATMDQHKLRSVVAARGDTAGGGGVVLVDVENVRGKSRFGLSHRDVLERATSWTEASGLCGKVTLVVDHGSCRSAYWLPSRGLSVVFAGPHRKADDVIARDVAFYETVVVVTADVQLMERCRKAASANGGDVHFIPPVRYLEQLEESTMIPSLSSSSSSSSKENNNNNNNNNHRMSTTEALWSSSSFEEKEDDASLSSLEKAMDHEIKLGAQLLEAESMLRRKQKKGTITNKRKKKLENRVRILREKLAARYGAGGGVLHRVTSMLSNNGGDSALREQQEALMARWGQIRTTSKRREATGDRVVLAEHFRRYLENDGDATATTKNKEEEAESVITTAVVDDNNNDDIVGEGPNDDNTTPAQPLIEHIHNNGALTISLESSSSSTEQITNHHDPIAITATDDDKKKTTLSLVVISDTHGFEHNLDQTENLPAGDVLLHLGDFSVDGPTSLRYEALRKFDLWLSKQPHPQKIVIRGNHDPHDFDFPISRSTFVTEPESLKIGDIVFSLVPYCSSRDLASRKIMQKPCDVLASHVPPYQVLDKCLTGKHAGSFALNRAVQKMSKGDDVDPPRLWLCGHIHEARGLVRKRFGKNSPRETVIINAANANPGRATHLVHRPIVVNIDSQKKEDEEGGGGIDVLQMEERSMLKDKERHDQNTFFGESSKEEKEAAVVGEMLMVVDLGLRSGVSLFNNRGELLRYGQFHFDSAEELLNYVPDLIDEWETKANAESSSSSSEEQQQQCWQVTHVAIEGGDISLLDVWDRAMKEQERDLRLLRVQPEEWRADLLIAKEKKSGKDAKAAARLIARQVVADYGSSTMEIHKGKFPTDVAESVVIGLYVSRKLGWIARREPSSPVRRYTNGSIVVPKGFG